MAQEVFMNHAGQAIEIRNSRLLAPEYQTQECKGSGIQGTRLLLPSRCPMGHRRSGHAVYQDRGKVIAGCEESV